MKKSTVLVAAASITLLAPGPAQAKPKDPIGPEQAARLECKAQKRADAAAFAATYGGRGMSACVAGERPEAKGAIRSSRTACQGERRESRRGFKRTYGNEGNGKHAFNRCVSSKVRSERKREQSEFKNAAEECREER